LVTEFIVLWNNKFRYQVASCWLLLLSQTAHKYVTLSWCTALQAGRSWVRFQMVSLEFSSRIMSKVLLSS